RQVAERLAEDRVRRIADHFREMRVDVHDAAGGAVDEEYSFASLLEEATVPGFRFAHLGLGALAFGDVGDGEQHEGPRLGREADGPRAQQEGPVAVIRVDLPFDVGDRVTAMDYGLEQGAQARRGPSRQL